MIETREFKLKNEELKWRKIRMKSKNMIYIVTFFMGLITPTWSSAENFVEPIIQGKVYKNWIANPKIFGKPIQVLKGGEDECNGGNFPDQYQFKNFSLLSNGSIQEVYLTQNNSLFFHNERISPNLKKLQFIKKFKNHIYIDSENPNVLNAEASDDSNDSIEFIFKNNQLLKYKLHIDDC